jgi:hypothetical protein
VLLDLLRHRDGHADDAQSSLGLYSHGAPYRRSPSLVYNTGIVQAADAAYEII